MVQLLHKSLGSYTAAFKYVCNTGCFSLKIFKSMAAYLSPFIQHSMQLASTLTHYYSMTNSLLILSTHTKCKYPQICHVHSVTKISLYMCIPSKNEELALSWNTRLAVVWVNHVPRPCLSCAHVELWIVCQDTRWKVILNCKSHCKVEFQINFLLKLCSLGTRLAQCIIHAW